VHIPAAGVQREPRRERRRTAPPRNRSRPQGPSAARRRAASPQHGSASADPARRMLRSAVAQRRERARLAASGYSSV